MGADASEKISGTLGSVIFHNPENGYTVFVLETPETEAGGDGVTCVGHFSEPMEGEELQLEGGFVNNHKYGRQFSVSAYERAKPTSAQGMEKYLASGVIKGLGEKTARRIVRHFGEKTFDVLENEPEKLAQVRGLTAKKALMFSEMFSATKHQRQAMLFLQNLGLSPASAMKVHKKYKDETIEAVRQNPYRLADEIDGIGFGTADAVAHRLGFSQDCPERISAGVRYSLWAATSDGHTYVPRGILVNSAVELLGLDWGVIDNELQRMQANRAIMVERLASGNGDGGHLVFATALYHAESYVARQLLKINGAHATESIGDEHAKLLAAAEAEGHITLSEGQRLAVQLALTKGALVVTGGPGTGKTTAINTIMGLLEAMGLTVCLAAPTGRAAKRMAEATGREAKTIHRLLEVSFMSETGRRQVFNRNEDNPIEADALVVDETSMMDVLLAQNLLRAVPEGTRLILVGDVDQLPSVGPGNFLKDIINSGTLPIARLSEVFRQAAQSAIITNAHRINRGEYPAVNEKGNDFFFVRKGAQSDIARALVELVTRRLSGFMGFDPKADIQVLTPMRKGQLGVRSLNQLLQERINPPSVEKREREYGKFVFREGDKVMQVRNNYDAKWEARGEGGEILDFGAGVFNGDMGVVESIDDERGLTVRFDESRFVEYEFSKLDELELAYAVTVHKSQGSEYRAVVMPIFSGPPMLFTRNLLYTAVTRAKELAVLVGSEECLRRMIDNSLISRRHTALERRLRTLADTLTLAGT